MKKFHFGENLRNIRQKAGISQESMAQQMKISQATYCRIEKQKNPRDYDQVLDLSSILKVSLYDLMPEWQGMDPSVIRKIYGTEVERKLKKLLNHPLSLIIMVGGAAALVDTLYQIAHGICEAFGASDGTIIFIKWTVALSALVYIIFLFVKLFRLKRELKSTLI
jgi:transcriptional regulator with XRE-family HTH domain